MDIHMSLPLGCATENKVVHAECSRECSTRSGILKLENFTSWKFSLILLGPFIRENKRAPSLNSSEGLH